jgi:hypothetical protein
MRQPFDYSAALKAMAGDQSQPSRWQTMAAIAGDTLMRAGGGQGGGIASILLQQRQQQQERLSEATQTVTDWQQRDWARQNQADLDAAAPFTIGRSRLQFDPASGDTQALYTGPEDFDLYAEGLGLQPGSPEYFAAVEDYVLRSSGPSAHDRDLAMDDRRTDNDATLEGIRYGNRLGLEGVRQSNRVGLEDTRQGNRVALRNMPPRRAAGAGRGGAASLPVVRTPAEAHNLPPGSTFRTPDGTVRRVPR